MPTRRSTLTAGSALALLSSARVQAAGNSDEKPDEIVALFVQSAKSVQFATDTKLLTLSDISPQTVFFSDRPERVAGNMRTVDFVPFWSDGKNSFLKDPPNADVSIFLNGTLQQIVAELTDPHLNGDTLTYTVARVLQGTFPVRANDVAVFIDIIGMPWTPVSYAGVARRSYRRAYWYRR